MLIDKIKKIINILPSYPHYKMNIFSGTNNKHEFKKVFKFLLLGKDIVTGEDINKYEKSIKNLLQNDDIYTFASGRMGFYTILKSIGIKEDDEVIIPSYTCIVVPNAIIYRGAKPVYCDIKNNDFNIDVSKIENLITDKTKVLYAQHTFGQMCDITAIKNIAKKHNLIIVEDAALALGAKAEEGYAGTIGDFGYFSTDRSKVINTGLGGFVSVNNEIFKEKFQKEYEGVPFLDKKYTKKIAITFLLNLIFSHPRVYWIGKFMSVILTKLNIMRYFLDEKMLTKPTNYSYPAKLSNILAKVGLTQMQNLDKNIQHRKKVAKYYNDILNIYTDDYINNSKNIFLRYSFLVNNRDKWEKKFSKVIELSSWFKSVTEGRDSNFEEIFYKIGSNTVSENATKHVLNLPTHNKINPKKLKQYLIALKNSEDIITNKGVL